MLGEIISEWWATSSGISIRGCGAPTIQPQTSNVFGKSVAEFFCANFSEFVFGGIGQLRQGRLNRAAPALTGDARLRIQPPYLKSKRSFDQSACFSLRPDTEQTATTRSMLLAADPAGD
jgi:hypothetical protein